MMNNIELVKEFCNGWGFNLFQEWLKTEKDIPGSEAEVILNKIDGFPVSIKAGKSLDRKFSFVAFNKSNGKSFTENDGMVFLAKDDLFLPTLHHYTKLVCEAIGHGSDEVTALYRMIGRVETYRSENPDICKLPDINGDKERKIMLG